MKTRFLLPICLLAVLAFPAWGADLLREGFDGMEKGKLPKGWECSDKTPEYYTNEKTYPTQPCLTLGESMTITTRTFPLGVTNVSFTSYTANDEGKCNKFTVSGWADGQWIEIARTDEMEVKVHQTFSFPVDNPQITRIQISFLKTYNASLDDVLVEGPFSVLFNREDEFRLPQGTGDAITAMAVYDFATEDTEFDYAWSGDMEGTDAVLEIPADLPPGTYEVTCTATVAGDEEISTSNTISFQVLEYHDIMVEECEHGTVTASAERAVEGTLVTLVAEPESEDYVLASIAINGEDLPRGTTEFTMPDTNVTVTAEFKLYEIGDLVITFDKNGSKSPAYASTKFESDGVVFDAVQCQGGDMGSTGYDGDKSMRVRHSTNGIALNGFFATADELEYPISRICFDYKAASSSHTGRKWALETSTDGAQWTNLATVTTAEGWKPCNVAAGIPENSFYFRVISANSGTTARMALFDNIHIWWGTPTFRVKLSGVEPGDRVVCDDDHPLVLAATGLDGTEPYEYAWSWTIDGGDGGTEEGETCSVSETGAYEVQVTCTDDDGTVATANVQFTIEKQYKVVCPEFTNGCSIVASTNKAFAGDTVTVEAKPKHGYTLEGEITATCGGEPVGIVDGAFVMPAGDVHISGTFRLVREEATLPFEWHGPWQTTTNTLDGVTAKKLGTDYDDKNYDGEGNGAAKFNDGTSIYQVRFDATPAELSYMIRGNSLGSCVCTVFVVWESADGMDWTSVAVYETEDAEVLDRLNGGTSEEKFALRPDSRYVKFGYKDASKGSGSIGIDAIAVTRGEDPDPEEPVVVTTTYLGDLSFGDDAAQWTVAIDPDAAISGSDVWTTTNLLEGSWHQADGASVEAAEGGKYRITVPTPEGPANFFSVGKPANLQ